MVMEAASKRSLNFLSCFTFSVTRLRRVVSTPGSYRQLRVSRCVCVHAQRLILGLSILVPGLERQNVLAADVAGYASSDVIHLIQRIREVCYSACARSQVLQSFAPLAPQSGPYQPNGIDGRTIGLLQSARSFFQRLLAHIVLTIRYHQQ